MATKKSSQPSVNLFNLLASVALFAAAMFCLPVQSSNPGLSYATITCLVLAVAFGVTGFVTKDKRMLAKGGVTNVLDIISWVYVVLGVVLLYEAIAEVANWPRLLNYSYGNYLTGFPVVEISFLGALFNAEFHAVRPKWLSHFTALLIVLGAFIWVAAIALYAVRP